MNICKINHWLETRREKMSGNQEPPLSGLYNHDIRIIILIPLRIVYFCLRTGDYRIFAIS